MEVVTTAVRKSEEEPKKSEQQLTYREKALKLVREKAVHLNDLDALKTDLFESDEELEKFIEDIYRYRRSFKA
jgi:hypothetical protein